MSQAIIDSPRYPEGEGTGEMPVLSQTNEQYGLAPAPELAYVQPSFHPEMDPATRRDILITAGWLEAELERLIPKAQGALEEERNACWRIWADLHRIDLKTEGEAAAILKEAARAIDAIYPFVPESSCPVPSADAYPPIEAIPEDQLADGAWLLGGLDKVLAESTHIPDGVRESIASTRAALKHEPKISDRRDGAFLLKVFGLPFAPSDQL